MSQNNRDEEWQQIAGMLAETGIDLPRSAFEQVNSHWRILEAMARTMATYPRASGSARR